jgi:PAS domain S-box-containing protein
MQQFKLKKIIIVILVFNFFISNQVKGSEVIVDVKNSEFPYFSYNKNQEPQGLIYDILIGIVPDSIKLTFKRNNTKSNNITVIYGYITKENTPSNYTFIDYKVPLNYYIFTRKETNIKSISDLLNRKIIVLKDDFSYNYLYRYKASHILKVKTSNEAMKMLALGINECAILPFQTGMYITDKFNYSNITYVVTPLLSFNIGVAVPDTEKDLINILSKGITESILDNTISLIKQKQLTYNADLLKQVDKITILLSIILIIALVIIAILFGIIKLLKKEIDASTKDYIQEIKKSNFSPLIIDLNNSLINKIIQFLPCWLYINDKNGKITYMNNTMKGDVFKGGDILPDNTTVGDIFKDNSDMLKQLNYYDEKLLNAETRLIVEKVSFIVNNERYSKWLIKYPLKIKGKSATSFINILTKPLMEGSALLSDILSNMVFNSVLNGLPDLIFIKNAKGQYLGGNRAFFSFYGKSEDEILGRTDIELIGEEKAKKNIHSDNLVLTTGAKWEIIEWDKSVSGQKFKFEKTKIPLKDKRGQIFGIVGISHDILLRHKYEQELALAKERAAESDRIKSSFLTNMSHEIRTPMNVIIGFSDLLADSDLTMSQREELIDMIQANGHILIDLIDDIIDFSRLETGQLQLKYSNFNINAIIHDAYSYGISKKNQLNKEHLNISFVIGSVEDEFIINSDPFRLRQILKNLFNNSIRFSTSESLFVGYIILDDKLLFYIKNGNNIVNDNIFNKLHSGKIKKEYSISEIEESSGISLIIANNVIEMLGGILYLEENIAGKPDFYFTIPLNKVENKTKKIINTKIMNIPDWPGKVILVAEDEEINYMLLKNVLQKTNVKLLRAENGREAINLFIENQSKIDLILMDIRMPEINGAEAARKILDIDSDAVIIAQTAYVMPEDKDQYVNAGIKAVIAKPIDPSELYYTCNLFLEQK